MGLGSSACLITGLVASTCKYFFTVLNESLILSLTFLINYIA